MLTLSRSDGSAQGSALGFSSLKPVDLRIPLCLPREHCLRHLVLRCLRQQCHSSTDRRVPRKIALTITRTTAYVGISWSNICIPQLLKLKRNFGHLWQIILIFYIIKYLRKWVVNYAGNSLLLKNYLKL